jgi:hypothetical protein
MLRPAKREKNERRKKVRFPMQREVRYKLLEQQAIVASGSGETLNMSSTGVAFRSDQALKTGSFIEVSISWPVLLDENCPMRLVVFGRLLRSDRGICACTVNKYEFRTQSRTLHAVSGGRADTMLRRWAETVRKDGGDKIRAGA